MYYIRYTPVDDNNIDNVKWFQEYYKSIVKNMLTSLINTNSPGLSSEPYTTAAFLKAVVIKGLEFAYAANRGLRRCTDTVKVYVVL